jgi:hypothetical protein
MHTNSKDEPNEHLTKSNYHIAKLNYIREQATHINDKQKILIYCDVHAVVLFCGTKGRYLVMTRHRTMDVSLESVPRVCLLYGLSPGYISRTMRQQLMRSE